MNFLNGCLLIQDSSQSLILIIVQSYELLLLARFTSSCTLHRFVNAKAPVGRLRVFYQDVASLQVNRKSFSKEPCLLQRKSGQDNKKSIVTFQLSYIILDMADIMFSFIMFVGPYLSSKCNSTWSNEQLTIPNVTPSIVNCNILKVVYFVKVRAVIREHSVDSQAIFLTLQASHL